MKNRINPHYWNGHLTNIIIGFVGLFLILIAIIIGTDKKISIILMSIGTSILATSIVSAINAKYIIKDTEHRRMLDYWRLSEIYIRRAEMNIKSNELLKKTKHLDITAMGLKGFRDSQGSEVEKCIENGMRLRILTINPESIYVREVDSSEGLADGSTRATIESLVQWISILKSKEIFAGQVELRFYDHYPYDFYFSLDGAVFIGPYEPKTSQQTITYEYNEAGKGCSYYRENFEILWRLYEEK